jgi:GTP-binding protein
MFVDELTIEAQAGRGGDGVVRWRQEKFVDRGGPAGGNGGHGGDVYMRAVRDVNLLARYTGEKSFVAENGTSGEKMSRHGRAGEDLTIDVPVGARVTDLERNRIYTFDTEGGTHRILRGGIGGLGNEHFKSSTNRSPDTGTKGKPGEKGMFKIELMLIVDVGIIGFPNAGKSTLLNTLTRARSRVGAYPFTTTEPYLGEFHGFILADIPGLIEGASEGKGLGHKFLRHVEKTKMLLHCISLEETDVLAAYQTIRNELTAFDASLGEKEELIVLTKSDLIDPAVLETAMDQLAKAGHSAVTVSAETGQGIDGLSSTLSSILHKRALAE